MGSMLYSAQSAAVTSEIGAGWPSIEGVVRLGHRQFAGVPVKHAQSLADQFRRSASSEHWSVELDGRASELRVDAGLHCHRARTSPQPSSSSPATGAVGRSLRACPGSRESLTSPGSLLSANASLPSFLRQSCIEFVIQARIRRPSLLSYALAPWPARSGLGEHEARKP